MRSDAKRSRAAENAVSKEQVFSFIERRFALADHNHDGQLDQDELALFAYSIACSFRKANAARHRSFSDALFNDQSLL